MAHEIYRKLYKKLLALYPRQFRERFGESMEQTYRDLCNEWAKSNSPSFGLLLRIFVDTGRGAIREHMSEITQKCSIRNAITSPWSAAMISLALCGPFAVSVIPFFDIEVLAGPVRAALTFDGQQLSMLGRFVVFGGVLLLPFAVLLNMVPMFTPAREGGKITFSPRPVNLVTGIAVLLPILIIARWMVFEAISCSRGICD